MWVARRTMRPAEGGQLADHVGLEGRQFLPAGVGQPTIRVPRLLVGGTEI